MLSDSWFTVLPDGPSSLQITALIQAHADRVIAGGAGFPWLLGCWPDGWATVAEAGPTRLAVLGRCPVTAAELAIRAGRVRRVADVDAAVRDLTGSYHVVACVDGQVRARGNVCGQRRVFHARAGGVVVAASRPDVLAAIANAKPDPQLLALRLASPALVYPIEEHTMWPGIQGLPPDHAIVIEPDGASRLERWWAPPEPDATLPEAAAATRQALISAVDSCAAGGGTISSDLSGGLDSTSLCFLAASGPARLVTAHWQGLDDANDDTLWAGRAAAHLPRAEHITFDRAETPLWFAGLRELRLVTEQPSPWVRDHARLAHLGSRMAAARSRLHIAGLGGDQLFTAAPSWPYDMVFRHPLKVIRQLRFNHAYRRLPLGPQLRGLAWRHGYGAWLRSTSARLTTPPSSDFAGTLMAWDTQPRMPVWVTPQGVEAVQSLIGQAVRRDPPPLAPQRSQHLTVRQVRTAGDTLREVDRFLTAHAGLGYAAPFLDDQVVEAALSLRIIDREIPRRFKALLVDAMRGIAPAPILSRTTKGDYSVEHHTAIHRHREELLSIFDDSHLAQAGLINPRPLREALLGTHSTPGALDGLAETLAVEIWLRGQQRSASSLPHMTAP